MYLKSIEVQGFKSFANKMKFDFHNGITGIVGPNGSGKSNVSDAVRWVLGEQKVKQLRSSSMQDVIFAGTENRKPQSFASVSITLDNSDHQLPLDYNEVTVGRRVYRSGESEYLLNGTACRLRDVQELFYDTGIGKDGYSIIGQGQIDKILSGKPEERRELFDEAAGIVKYKRRKMTAQKKLENEQQNLLRVTDILKELERQVGPLEKQSEQAKIYLKKKEELKTYDVNLFLTEMERITTDTADVDSKQEIAAGQQEELSGEYEKIRLRYEELEASIAETDQMSADLQQQVTDAGVEREKLDGRIRVLQEQIHTIEQSESHVQERVEQLGEEISQKEKSGKDYSDEKNTIDEQIKVLQEEKAQIQKRLDECRQETEDCEKAIEFGKNEVIRLLNQRGSLQGEMERYDAILEQSGIRKSQLNQQILTRKSTGSDVDSRLSKQEAEYDRITEEILEQEKRKISMEQNHRKWKTQMEELQAQIAEHQHQYHRDSSRLESLKNIAERYDGYGNSIRRVMDRKSNMPGIHGVVADIIRVPKKYEIAIETALGGTIQNIVTDNEQTAKELIAYLKQNRFGRATFLPLTSVSGPKDAPARKALHETGSIGMADELVETDSQYRQIAGYLLGRVLVVDTIDHAIAMEKKYHYSLRIVTLEGESLQPGGSMSGGAYKNNSNLLGRNREIEALEKAIAQGNKKQEELKQRLEDVQTANALVEEDLEELQQNLQEMYLSQNTSKMELEHFRAEKQQQEASFREITQEVGEISAQERQISDEKLSIDERLKASHDREQEILSENEKLQADLETKTAEAAAIAEELSAFSLKVAQEEQKSEFMRENIQRVAEEILVLHQKQQEILTNAAGGKQDIEEKQKEITDLTARMQECEKDQETLQGRLKECMSKKETMSGENKQFFDKRESLSADLSRLDKELFRLNDRKEKLAHEEERLTNYMWQEYELTLHTAMPLKSEGLTGTAELKKLINGVKDDIRKLGNVNVNAIEEYKEIGERYTFLKGQHADLEEAEATLLDIIKELDEGMRKQFSESFKDIQREFDKAFKSLFGGGKGTLELAEGDDILETGINIIAQPPGKKLQNMMQLSGGEKALTAISLLFAIQNLKPSPFCLLDEIEAALDETNVDRFAKYLHRLTKNTQFIVITHRRGTMTAADRLYGITMQEKGVSALVSVNLIEEQLDN